MEKKVLWLGVTPLIPETYRSKALVRCVGDFFVAYPGNTGGMEEYEYIKVLLDNHDVIATDQSVIDESWENFFSDKENEGKTIYKWDGSSWNELKPGFSKDQEISSSNTK